MLEHADDTITPAEAQIVLNQVFAVAGRLSRLSGERDQNFLAEADDGHRWVLKISNSAENRAVTDLQTRLLLHLEAVDAALPVPRVGRTRRGETEYLWLRDGGRPPCVARLFSVVEGRPMNPAALDLDARDRLGRAIARLDLAMRDFRHPAEGHELLWDLQQADKLAQRLALIDDPRARALAEAGLARSRPYLESGDGAGAGRRQMIHNDLNPDNVFLSGVPAQVSGFIDFGDAVRAPLIQELAVAAAYHLRADAAPLAAVAPLARGYDAVLPLREAEMAALPDLIVLRLAVTVTITSWRAKRHPDNRDYILRNQPAALAGLARLLGDDGRRAADALVRTLRETRA